MSAILVNHVVSIFPIFFSCFSVTSEMDYALLLIHVFFGKSYNILTNFMVFGVKVGYSGTGPKHRHNKQTGAVQ